MKFLTVRTQRKVPLQNVSVMLWDKSGISAVIVPTKQGLKGYLVIMSKSFDKTLPRFDAIYISEERIRGAEMKETQYTVVIFSIFRLYVSHGIFATFSLCSPIYLTTFDLKIFIQPPHPNIS